MATGACAVIASAEWTRMASQTEVQWARAASAGRHGRRRRLGAVYVAPQGVDLVALVSLVRGRHRGGRCLARQGLDQLDGLRRHLHQPAVRRLRLDPRSAGRMAA